MTAERWSIWFKNANLLRMLWIRGTIPEVLCPLADRWQIEFEPEKEIKKQC